MLIANKANLTKLLEKNNYIVSRKQLTQLNYSDQQIKKYLENHILILLDKGIYGRPDCLRDPFYTVKLRLRKGIISLSSALYLYGYSDRVPEKIELIFPNVYKNSKLKYQVICHQQLPKLYKLGVTLVKTPPK